MQCIHGFEESVCPTCRIDKMNIPPSSNKLINDHSNFLKAENPYFKKHLALKNEFEKHVINSNKIPQPIFTELLPTPKLLNPKPGLQEEGFLKKLNEYNLKYLGDFNILKKEELKKPELDLGHEE